MEYPDPPVKDENGEYDLAEYLAYLIELEEFKKEVRAYWRTAKLVSAQTDFEKHN